MKHRFIVITTILVVLSGPCSLFAAGWVLYDDFSSGALDDTKWKYGNPASTVSIENEQLKLEHKIGFPDQSGWVRVAQPENYKGIRATFRVESCTGDVRVRFGAQPGVTQNDILWTSFTIRTTTQTIDTYTGYVNSLVDDQYAHFMKPQTIIGKTFTLSLFFPNNNEISYEVNDQGKITKKLETVFTPNADFAFLGVGTKSTNGDGPCVAYVDDIYVLEP